MEWMSEPSTIPENESEILSTIASMSLAEMGRTLDEWYLGVSPFLPTGKSPLDALRGSPDIETPEMVAIRRHVADATTDRMLDLEAHLSHPDFPGWVAPRAMGDLAVATAAMWALGTSVPSGLAARVTAAWAITRSA